ncbi:hypothetical protein ON010_g7200 [Phytophthora cinnamomi]|nr:hypothetical protein ON010_g7200 [Phytophthora cinnamomi]
MLGQAASSAAMLAGDEKVLQPVEFASVRGVLPAPGTSRSLDATLRIGYFGWRYGAEASGGVKDQAEYFVAGAPRGEFLSVDSAGSHDGCHRVVEGAIDVGAARAHGCSEIYVVGGPVHIVDTDNPEPSEGHRQVDNGGVVLGDVVPEEVDALTVDTDVTVSCCHVAGHDLDLAAGVFMFAPHDFPDDAGAAFKGCLWGGVGIGVVVNKERSWIVLPVVWGSPPPCQRCW